VLAAKARTLREDHLGRGLLDPESRRVDHELAARREPLAVRDREERQAVKRHLLEARLRVEEAVEQQMAALVGRERHAGAGEKLPC
jgi:hypothetical protein